MVWLNQKSKNKMKGKYVINNIKKQNSTSSSSSSALFKNKKLNLAFKIIKLVFVRAILVTICGLLTSFYICITNLKYIYLLFILPIIVIVIETIYICVRRHGRDFNWYLITFF